MNDKTSLKLSKRYIEKELQQKGNNAKVSKNRKAIKEKKKELQDESENTCKEVKSPRETEHMQLSSYSTLQPYPSVPLCYYSIFALILGRII